MLQAEVVDRMTASPGTKAYGPLTVAVGVDAIVTRLLTLPPGAFRPPPKVTSAVVRLAFPVPPPYAGLPDTFEPMVRSIFTMRRKTIGNALAPMAEAAGTEARSLLAAAGVDPRRRPETLPLSTLIELARALTAASRSR
jgi:16S rRNA (adenine1518-N6/adenine1519-N6)-dimethyltransferase